MYNEVYLTIKLLVFIGSHASFLHLFPWITDSSTRCNEDFQWIRKKSPGPLTFSATMEGRQIFQNKPPINRQPREKTPRRVQNEKSGPGSLDRRKHLHYNRLERDQRSRSSHVVKSPSRFEDFTSPPPPHQPCQNWCCNSLGNSTSKLSYKTAIYVIDKVDLLFMSLRSRVTLLNKLHQMSQGNFLYFVTTFKIVGI